MIRGNCAKSQINDVLIVYFRLRLAKLVDVASLPLFNPERSASLYCSVCSLLFDLLAI